MDDNHKNAYTSFAYTFIGLGSLFLIVSILELVFAFGFFKANPFPVALLVLGIGVALLWTLKQAKD